MQTDFSPEQLADPRMAQSESVIRKCVHCGFCTATCPTYVLLGNELDSPRGRIYLMKDMLEKERMPDSETVRHIDRCLSCLSCRTTCPSGVDYMRLVDHARAYIHENYRRPWHDRLVRALLAGVLPYPRRFVAMVGLARWAKPLAPLLARVSVTAPLAAMLRLAPARLPGRSAAAPDLPATEKGRVAILRGCAEAVLQPQVHAAAERLLARMGFRTVAVTGEGCCGALVHHLGREEASMAAARRNIDAWWPLVAGEGLAAIIVTASGCGVMVKDYGHLLRDDPAYAERAARIAALARDVSEFIDARGLPPEVRAQGVKVAYHPPCSLQHGQRIDAPLRLLRAAGYEVSVPRDAHLCCGSAGTYNILQPEIAAQLGARKVEMLDAIGAEVIATGNIGCAVQIGRGTKTPVVHVVELLDRALSATGRISPGL